MYIFFWELDIYSYSTIKSLPCSDWFECLGTPPNVNSPVVQEGQSGCVHLGPPGFAPKPGGQSGFAPKPGRPLVCTLVQVGPTSWILLQGELTLVHRGPHGCKLVQVKPLGFVLVQTGPQLCTLVQAGPPGFTLEQ